MASSGNQSSGGASLHPGRICSHAVCAALLTFAPPTVIYFSPTGKVIEAMSLRHFGLLGFVTAIVTDSDLK